MMSKHDLKESCENRSSEAIHDNAAQQVTVLDQMVFLCGAVPVWPQSRSPRSLEYTGCS